MADLIVSDNKTVFSETVESMKSDDSRSQRVRFAVTMGPLSKLLPLEDIEVPEVEEAEASVPHTIDLEAQGIMVYDGASGGESHVSPRLASNFPASTTLINLPARPCG